MAPALRLSVRSGTTRSASKRISVPRPSHLGQAPAGALKENRRGSISSMVKPETGQANRAENVMRSCVSFFDRFGASVSSFDKGLSAYSASAIPSASSSAVSKLSASRVAMSARTTRRSTTTSMSCLYFLSSLGASAIS